MNSKNTINWALFKGIGVGALGGLLFGFDTAVIAGTTHALSTTFHLSARALGLTVSIALWGTVVGSLGSGYVGQNLGSKRALQIMALLYALSAAGSAFAWNWSSLVLFRFVGGLGIGGSSVLCPVYMAELAPPKWRGRLVGLFQINVVLGVLLAYSSNFLISQQISGPSTWRLELGIAGLPALIFFTLLLTIPESARWLVLKGNRAEALNVLRSMRGEGAISELNQIVDSIGTEKVEKSEPLLQRKYAFPIFLAASMGAFNQLSGINAILYYLNDIFAAGGYASLSSGVQTVAVGLMNLIATALALTVIDKVGRKSLLLAGSVGMVISLSGISAVMFHKMPHFLLFPLLTTYTFSFAMSQGAVIWVFISEIFPNLVRSKGQSLGTSVHWIMNAIVAGVFPAIAARNSAYPFVFFAAMMAAQFLVVLMVYPETKQLSLEQLQEQMQSQQLSTTTHIKKVEVAQSRQ
jgi:MFS transporter, SP family, arabinose:H+ symporter